METITNNREKLINTVNYMTEEQAKFFDTLINNLAGQFSKRDLIELSHDGNTNGIDSALPLNYVRRIQEIHPNFKTLFHCYNYQTNTYGEMENVAETLILKMKELFV